MTSCHINNNKRHFRTFPLCVRRLWPLPLRLTCAADRTGVNLTVVTPAGSQGAAALVQGDVAGQHAFTQVLVVEVVVTLLTLH